MSDGASRPGRRITKWLRLGRRLFALSVGRFIQDRCFIGASALSYSTLVSLIPLVAVAFVMFSAFPMFAASRDHVLAVVLRDFAPEISEDAAAWVAFAANNAAQTTAVGLVSLVATAILLLATIEDQMNLIFRVERPRDWSQRVVVYWTVLTMGPVLLGLGMSVSASLEDASGATGVAASGLALVRAMMSGGTVVVRWLPEAIMLGLLYGLMPRRRVHWHCAAVGAAVAAVVLEVLKLGYGTFVSQIASYNRVYGAVAGIPIFLLWTYIFWIDVLLGAEIAASLVRRRDSIIAGAVAVPLLHTQHDRRIA